MGLQRRMGVCTGCQNLIGKALQKNPWIRWNPMRRRVKREDTMKRAKNKTHLQDLVNATVYCLLCERVNLFIRQSWKANTHTHTH